MHDAIRNTVVLAALMLLGGSGLYAQRYQSYPPYGYDPYARGPVYTRPGNWNGLGLYDRVQADLNRAAYDTYGSRKHINHARKEVGDVQHDLSRGRFNRDEMGEAIGAVQRVVEQVPLPEADRSMLWRDLNEMRRFRGEPY